MLVNIKRFTLAATKKHLTIVFNQGQVFELSYEYLRVFSPAILADKAAAITAHKKQVQLQHIESVGKHGYRFRFDDQHSAIYSADYLYTLSIEQSQRWQQYLAQLKASGYSREAIITMTQL